MTRHNYLNDKSYNIPQLNPGNYSIQVMAYSLAGEGNYSESKYILIEVFYCYVENNQITGFPY